MKKENIIKKSIDFTKIIKTRKSYKYKDYIIYVDKNNQNTYKFGLSVGKKIGNAVVRNKIKRQLRSIIDQKDYQNNFNCIIIIGRGITQRSFSDMAVNLYKAFADLKLFKED